MDGRTDGRTGGRAGRQTYRILVVDVILSYILKKAYCDAFFLACRVCDFKCNSEYVYTLMVVLFREILIIFQIL